MDAVVTIDETATQDAAIEETVQVSQTADTTTTVSAEETVSSSSEGATGTDHAATQAAADSSADTSESAAETESSTAQTSAAASTGTSDDMAATENAASADASEGATETGNDEGVDAAAGDTDSAETATEDGADEGEPAAVNEGSSETTTKEGASSEGNEESEATAEEEGVSTDAGEEGTTYAEEVAARVQEELDSIQTVIGGYDILAGSISVESDLEASFRVGEYSNAGGHTVGGTQYTADENTANTTISIEQIADDTTSIQANRQVDDAFSDSITVILDDDIDLDSLSIRVLNAANEIVDATTENGQLIIEDIDGNVASSLAAIEEIALSLMQEETSEGAVVDRSDMNNELIDVTGVEASVDRFGCGAERGRTYGAFQRHSGRPHRADPFLARTDSVDRGYHCRAGAESSYPEIYEK